MALAQTYPDAPQWSRLVNLADARLGATALLASDEFFAAKERMLNPDPAEFIAGKYDAHGKWMDGWETRRKRVSGHDWCVVQLARHAHVRGFDLDTSHFTGNFPPAASVEGCFIASGEPDAQTRWFPLLAASNLSGNRHHWFEALSASACTHVRVNLYPDGGLARLRVYGIPEFDPQDCDDEGLIDLAAAIHGGRALAANNEHFGLASNLLMPGRGVNMGDGWETRRRREPGNDWCLIALARPGIVEAVEVDTCHFKGNYPDRCSIQAALVHEGTIESLVTQSMFWPVLLPEQKLQMDHEHPFRDEIAAIGRVSHIRFNIFPDGGVSRLRVRGRPC